MSMRERMTVAAGLAVLLAGSALVPLYGDAHWVPRAAGAVLVVTLVGLVCRRLAVPTLLQPPLALLALVLFLCEAFARGTLHVGLVPGSRTVHAFAVLVRAAQLDIRNEGPPVPSHLGLVLLTAAGAGAVALAVDVLAVLLERAAVAGLPLLVLLAVPSSVLPGGLGWLPFALGAAGWLGLLLVEGGERVGRWGAPARSAGPGARPGGDDSSLGRVGRRIGGAALGVAVLLPALIPGLDTRLVGGSGSSADGSSSGGTRSTTTYNPITALGKQLELPTPRQLFAYTTTDPQPDYLRMTTLDRYDGNGWQASPLTADRQGAKVQKGIPATGGAGRHQALSMKIAMDSLRVHWLPVPFGTTSVNVKGTWLWDPTSSTVFSTERDTKGLRPYTLTANRTLPDRTALTQAGATTDPDIQAKYGHALDVSSYVQQTTDAITQGTTSDYAKAVALQAWFRDPRVGFVYDLKASTPSPVAKDPLEAFLRGKHGFCEQYATAMAVMLRAAGVPSRVAVGFTPGTRVGGRNWSVTTSDAHAWPEAWFPGSGWLRFEPTPSLSRSVVPAYSVPPTTPGAAGDPGVAGVTPQPTPTFAKHGLLDPERLLNQPATGSGSTAGRSAGGVPWRWLVPTAALVLLSLPALLSGVRRRRRWNQPAALTAWEQLQDDAVDIGHRWHPSQSPRTAASGLAAARRLPAPAAAALDRVAAAAERARYAPGGGGPTAGLREDAAAIRSALLAGCSAQSRLQARLLPASTLGWIAVEGGARGVAVLDRLDDLVAAVSRVIRRPLGLTRAR